MTSGTRRSAVTWSGAAGGTVSVAAVVGLAVATPSAVEVDESAVSLLHEAASTAAANRMGQMRFTGGQCGTGWPPTGDGLGRMVLTPPTTGFVHSDGLNIAYLDWGGTGPPLVMLHPTGFCGGFFAPLAERLVDSFRPIAVDLRGHGNSDTPEEPADLHFDLMAADVVAVLERLEIDDVRLIGVSMGGAVGIHVAGIIGARVKGLMACEAIAFAFERAPSENSNHMAMLARKRRAVWPSRAAMVESYGSRPPFNALASESLAAYVEWGTRERDDGTVELACAPEIEARSFEIGGSARSTGRAFELLGEIECPRAVLAGHETDLEMARFRTQAAQAGVELRVLEGGHFFLQEDTDRAEALVREILS